MRSSTTSRFSCSTTRPLPKSCRRSRSASVSSVNLKDELGKAFNVFHRNVFIRSKGRLMGKLIGMPVLLLETTGRKSGKKRQTMLTSPHQEGDKVVIVA